MFYRQASLEKCTKHAPALPPMACQVGTGSDLTPGVAMSSGALPLLAGALLSTSKSEQPCFARVSIESKNKQLEKEGTNPTMELELLVPLDEIRSS